MPVVTSCVITAGPVKLRQSVHLGTKGKIYLWLFDTQSELPRPFFFLISLSHVISRGVPKGSVTLNGEC